MKANDETLYILRDNINSSYSFTLCYFMDEPLIKISAKNLNKDEH